MRRIVIVALAVTALFSMRPSELQAGVSDAGVLFLRIAAGARAAGMGESFVAVADDATAAHWNPAGLGSFPLASEFHEVRLTDDRLLREKSSRILLGDVPADYSERIGQFLLRKDGVVRVTDAGEESLIELPKEAEVPVVRFIATNVRLDDRDLLKAGVRAVAEANTGGSFDQINSMRLRLTSHLGAGEAGKLNQLFETLIADWQNFQLQPGSVQYLDQKVSAALMDNSVSDDEFGEIVEALVKSSRATEVTSVKVPYEVLLALWKDYSLPWEPQILDIALLRNDVPEDNYKRYDLWAITPNGLVKWDGSGIWQVYQYLYPSKSETAAGLLAAYTGESDEEKIRALKDQIAALNYGISKSEIDGMVASINVSFTADVQPTESFTNDLAAFESWYSDMVIDPQRLSLFIGAFNRAMADSLMEKEEADRLEFAMHACNVGRLLRSVKVPYSLPFSTIPSCISATEKLLWVGSDQGLYLFNGRAWQRYSEGDKLPSTKINALSADGDNSLWVATGRGVAHYYKGGWTVYTAEAGLSDDEFTAVHAQTKDYIWAAAGTKLFFFDGKKWRSNFTYTAGANDSLPRVVRTVTGVVDKDHIDKIVADLKSENRLESDILAPGTEVLIPYAAAFQFPITAMTYETDRQRLWIGTTSGLKIFEKGKFESRGYKSFTAPKDMTVKDAAIQIYGNISAAELDDRISRIKSYNHVEGGTIVAGQTILAYSNSLGGEIRSLTQSGSDILIGTDTGVLKYSDGTYSKYYHKNLDRERAVGNYASDGDMWFATPQKAVVYAGAQSEIVLMHANYAPELAPDLYYEYISYVRHLSDDWGTIGISATFLSYGAIPRTREGSSEVVDTFHAFDGALSLSWGTRVSPSLSFGMSAKVIYSRLTDQGTGAELGKGTATVFAVDFGALYRTPFPRLTLGAAVTNLGPNIVYIDAAQSDPLPRNLAIGAAYDLFKNRYNKMTLVAEINKRITDLNDGFSEELKEAIQSIGFEYWYGSFIALRGGYRNDDAGAINYFTVGAGLQYKNIRFDFAYIPSSESVPLANTLRISMTGRL